MSKDSDRDATDDQPPGAGGLKRRQLLAGGAAAGVGATVLSAPGAASAKAEAGIEWDYEVDVLVIGAGCAGLPAAIRARDLGAQTVLVLDQNYDVGGRMLHSGGWVSLGGGDPVQERDRSGDTDEEGFVSVDPQYDPEQLEDDPELLFTDMTDWSIIDPAGQHPYRFNERDLNRAWADNCPATRQFCMENYVRFSRIDGTHGGGGLSRPRAARTIMRTGDVTDFAAGVITDEDAGIADPERTSTLAPVKMANAALQAGPDMLMNGVALARPLEYSAREKGVQFMLNRHMDEVIREQPFSGRVLGVRASYTPRHNPDTGERLESYWQQGNVDERRETITIRARRAVVLGSGGHAGNPEFRSMFYPAMREPAFVTSGWSLLGDGGQDASGIIAGLRVGANLAGMQQNLSYPTTFHISSRIGTRDAYTAMYPGHPTFPFRRSTGYDIGSAGFEELIAVNQVGKRFYNEARLQHRIDMSRFPGGAGVGTPNEGMDHVPTDWRNSRPEWVREMYDYSAGIDAALAINEGSRPPHYYSGPLWAIFDQAAVDRMGWELRYPYVSDEDGYFFKADTIEELMRKINAGHPFQRVPMSHLPDTVERWNGFAENGEDEDFERHADAPMNPVEEPPFYAASIMVIWHDSYGGLRINGRAQVVDMQGQVIPGLYAGGEVAGGVNKHGLGRGLVQGYIAGTSAVRDPV